LQFVFARPLLNRFGVDIAFLILLLSLGFSSVAILVWLVPASALIAVLDGVEQRLERARIAHSKAAAPSVKEFAVTLKQVDARKPQRQWSRPIKLLVG
jgi:hypothetical protein